jgi:hypothetical protein
MHGAQNLGPHEVKDVYKPKTWDHPPTEGLKMLIITYTH